MATGGQYGSFKMKRFKLAGPILGLVLFVTALAVIQSKLSTVHYHDVIQDLKSIPTSFFLIACLLTLLNYLVLTGYDTLAFRYIKRPLQYMRIAFASFIGYAFSNNFGLSMIAGSSVRYRLYSAWGLSTLDITRVVAFYNLSFLLGLFSLSGVVFCFEAIPLPVVFHHFGIQTTRSIGIILLAIVFLYFSIIMFHKKPFQIFKWNIESPSLSLALTQVGVSSLDWLLAALTLYILVSSMGGISFAPFLGVFLIAQIMGLLSQVPGGLGVFESVVLALLPVPFPEAQVLAILVAYRIIYYFFPLLTATLFLGLYEFFEHRHRIQRGVAFLGRWVPRIIPNVQVFMTFVAGAILLFSGAIPTHVSRLAWFKDLLPLPVMEISHFLGSITGTALLILAYGLQRRLNGAYLLSVLMLASGIVFSILKGLNYEEAIVLSIMLVTILPSGKYFYRKTSFLNEPLTGEWAIAILLIIAGSVWLGMFAYKHVDYSHDLWWRFAIDANAPRFLRASVGAITVLLFFSINRLIRPVQPKPTLPTADDLMRLQPIIEKSTSTSVNIVFLGDKEILLSENGNAFIMYGIHRRSWVAFGDPIGPQDEARELLWRFREMADRYNARIAFYDVSQKYLPLYLDMGLTLLKTGEEAFVSLQDFSLEGNGQKYLRYIDNRFHKEGYSFEVIPREQVRAMIPTLKKVSDAWLLEKKTREKRFSLGFFSSTYLENFPVAIVRKNDEIFAFANIWPSGTKQELSVDLMRYYPHSRGSVMDYLFVHLFLWGRQQGYMWFNMGVAPLSGFERRHLSPIWNKITSFVFDYGENFYNFQGLRQYKEKFSPEWRPKFLASPGGLVLPVILTDVATLISGGLRGLITK